jgi:PAS domain S-box-containing protein
VENNNGDTSVSRNYRLFKRLIIATVIALILLIFGFSVWKSQAEYRLTIQSAELQSRGYARALKEHAERAFSEADNVLLDTIDHIKTHGGIEGETSSHLREFVTRHSTTIPQVGAIILVNRTGQLFAHSLNTPAKQANVADREYFIHHRSHPDDDTPFISRPIKSRINDKWRFTLSRPVRSASGTFEGLVAVAFEMDYFQKINSSLELGQMGRIVILRNDGVLLLAEPFNEKDFSVDFSKSHLIRTYLPRSPKGTYHIPKGKALLENNARIISYESLDTFPVVVNANMGTDEVVSQWRSNTYKQSIIVTATSLFMILLTVLLLRLLKNSEQANCRQLEQQKEIAEAAASWQTTFDSVADAIWVMDLNKTILRHNKATATIFGRNTDAVAGHICCEVAHNSSSPLTNCPFQKMLDTGQHATMQLENGEQWFEISVDPIRDDSGAITGAVHIISDITSLKQAEERYRKLVDNLPIVVWQTDDKGTIHYISPVITRIDGYTPEEVYAGGIDQIVARIHPDDRERAISAFAALFSKGAVFDEEFRIQHKDGHWLWIHDFAYATISMNGMQVAHGIVTDITHRRTIEEERDLLELQLRQAQKMEAIGHLAGGVAHDFNNLLTPILGYAEMAAAATSPGDPLEPKIAGIITAANKAKALTHQLLSFGRRQAITTEVVDINEIILSFNNILRRTIKESIRIDLVLDPEGAFIKADRSQIEQIILNMTVNAQDAFDGGHGRINIETCKILMDGENARMHPGMSPGNYILLSFRDNGCGMSNDVINHIFEPFFTTKQVGHGTGLGLATVYGIVKQHDAFIAVSSHEGRGTTFNIYFPLCSQVPLLTPHVPQQPHRKDAHETTILVVEDNDMVRDMVQEMLKGYHFTVLSAADPHQAIELLESGDIQIDLLVSDVVMPGMNGPELYEQLVIRIPTLKAVYISGYPINPSLRGGVLEEDVTYLQKPFTAEALLERINMVL